jgi:copper resistance protein B
MRIASATSLFALSAAAPAEAQQLAYADLGEPAAARLDYAAVQADDKPSSRPPWLRYALLDRLEWSPRYEAYSWDLAAFLGGEKSRVWVSTTGDGSFGGSLEYLELQAMFSRQFRKGWDWQAGLRFDARPHPQRVYLGLGGQADVTDALWLGAHAYVSQKGELSARAYGQYNQSIGKRLVLQPSFEVDFYGSDIEALGIGHGLSFGEAGLRLRYLAAKEKFAPYIGYSRERLFGRAARMAREAGDEASTGSFILGVRSQF